MLEYKACSEDYREKTTQANVLELGFVMRKMYKAGHQDHPLDYYIVVTDLDRGFYTEAGLFAGRSIIQTTFIIWAIFNNLKNDF
jgi:hypothetical protein